MEYVDDTVYIDARESVRDPVSYVALGAVEDSVTNKLRTYDFTIHNK
jgi:hypothetical protein